jgi:hypothetical protein
MKNYGAGGTKDKLANGLEPVKGFNGRPGPMVTTRTPRTPGVYPAAVKTTFSLRGDSKIRGCACYYSAQPFR